MWSKLEMNVIPNNDLKNHMENHLCNCSPSIKEFEDRVLIVHNAFDGREFEEVEENYLLNPEKDWSLIYYK